MLTFVPNWDSLRSSAPSVQAQRRRKTRCNCLCTPVCVSLISIGSCALCVKQAVVSTFIVLLLACGAGASIKPGASAPGQRMTSFQARECGRQNKGGNNSNDADKGCRPFSWARNHFCFSSWG